ncbi:probable U3 small nucleolar RNA-associated protein 11 [Varroa jacobsoni]|uniref:U3 small nucleolar RNA-associated protein 11 n=1 Tax=Varroa destructor TaxID=109461 RepID=A0A7M7JNE6_VARDE|nr:probable U3 small nucleolar RNA-associated protein 11 [Varroa destructor]XP_022654805.1 probable U3 small nucleolar RNA-associated protein 11 [Varroa destructor]XP_022705107.1 probable U3 small nucleolar RNA-associated protein 11 [Varroa jacobsoni]
MSSFAKSNKAAQRIHKERHQLEDRQHLGALEKKKDYRIRAKDANTKRAQIKRLRQRILEKNADEFYFHMKNSALVNGVHYDKVKGQEFTDEQLKLMQTQDHRYIQMKRVIETQKIEKLKSELHCIGLIQEVTNNHTFFDDDGQPIEKVKNLDKKLGTAKELLDRKYNRLKIEDLLPEMAVDEETLKEAAKETKRKYHELESRIKRERELRILEEKVRIKKLLLDKKQPPKTKLQDGSKDRAPVYIWATERKR